ncbi:MAG: fbpA 1 [Herbaspirillum sp.]|jgi:iron(III) transport system substrate-binding protein|nr:fbpA 1 [Herbaspirillum sp.]
MAITSLIRRLCMTLAIGAIAAAAPVAGFAQDMSLLNYTGADRAQKLEAAAKKEGGLLLYTSFAEKDLPPLISGFEKKYGIKVTVWRSGSDKVLQRSLTETAAKRYEVDAIHIGAPEMEALHREQVLQPVTSPAFKDLLPNAVPKHREWASTLLTVWVQAYNTNLIKKADLPKSYRDLLDPKWKGKLGIEADDFDWFAEAVAQVGQPQGLKLFQDIVAQNGISVRKGHTLLTNLVAAGEVPLALTTYNYMPVAAKRKGAPVEWFVIEPAIARANAIGIARHAPHPAAAMLFYDYMLGAEGQTIMAGLDYVPSNTTVTSPMKGIKIKLEDPVTTLDQMEKWTKIYNDTLQGKK